MKRLGIMAFGVASLLLAQSEQQTPAPIPAQPVPFNHKQHMALGVKCLDCHPIRKPGFVAGYPQERTCMGCHTSAKTDSPAVKKLAEFHKTKTPIPWVKVYKVPEYVWFSHEAHHREASLACETCHGPVAERELIVQEKPTSMTSCIECHDKRGVSQECNFCHETR